MTKIMVSFLCILTFLNAESINQEYENNENFQSEIIDESDIETETETESKVDCLILEDENSIICKFETSRKIDDENSILAYEPFSTSKKRFVLYADGSIEARTEIEIKRAIRKEKDDR